MNQHPKSNQQSHKQIEILLTILLLVLCVLLVALIIVTIGQGNSEKDPSGTATTPTQSNSGTQQTTPDDPVIDPSMLEPVFANGVLPTVLPMTTEATVELSDTLTSPYGVIIDVANNKVLAGKGADTLMKPASMTKVMTLIVACEKLTKYDLTQRMVLTEYYNEYDYNGLDLGLINGDKYLGDSFYIEDLLYGIGVSSSADCVLMIAEKTYGSLDQFVVQMNQKVLALGLTKTRFVDAAGDDLDGNVTTAKEMAVIMTYAMQNPLICKILSEDSHIFKGYYIKDGVEASYTRYFQSHLLCKEINSRIKRYEDTYGTAFKLDTTTGLMGKTGYLNNPDRSYLVCAAKGRMSGSSYVVVVGENDSFAKTMKDIKYLFDTYAT